MGYGSSISSVLPCHQITERMFGFIALWGLQVKVIIHASRYAPHTRALSGGMTLLHRISI